MMNTSDEHLRISLLLLRLSVFVVMLMWTLDKFLNPAHAAGVYEHFYFIGGLGPQAVYVIGAFELLILLGFVAGILKTWTYAAVLLFHAVSTLSAIPQYFAPFEASNLLFFAAWPMLAACIALFLMRRQDQLGTLS